MIIDPFRLEFAIWTLCISDKSYDCTGKTDTPPELRLKTGCREGLRTSRAGLDTRRILSDLGFRQITRAKVEKVFSFRQASQHTFVTSLSPVEIGRKRSHLCYFGHGRWQSAPGSLGEIAIASHIRLAIRFRQAWQEFQTYR